MINVIFQEIFLFGVVFVGHGSVQKGLLQGNQGGIKVHQFRDSSQLTQSCCVYLNISVPIFIIYTNI